MTTTSSDPLFVLSLARTALSDPAALPDADDVHLADGGEIAADPRHVAYAVAQIDRALVSLRFEYGCETTLDAAATIRNLGGLVTSAADELSEFAAADPAAAARAAAAQLEAVATSLVAPSS